MSSAATLIKGFEVGPGGSPYLQAIPDTNGRWQIGYGSTWNYDNNRYVVQGDKISFVQANNWMNTEIREKQKVIQSLVKVPVSTNQMTAMISLAYNIGTTAFTHSTLLRLLNEGANINTVADQFDRWIYAEGIILQGLVRRRAAEKDLFLL